MSGACRGCGGDCCWLCTCVEWGGWACVASAPRWHLVCGRPWAAVMLSSLPRRLVSWQDGFSVGPGEGTGPDPPPGHTAVPPALLLLPTLPTPPAAPLLLLSSTLGSPDSRLPSIGLQAPPSPLTQSSGDQSCHLNSVAVWGWSPPSSQPSRQSDCRGGEELGKVSPGASRTPEPPSFTFRSGRGQRGDGGGREPSASLFLCAFL